MRRSDFRGQKCVKRNVEKCEGVCKTMWAIQYAYSDVLASSEDVESFRVNVELEGIELEGSTHLILLLQRQMVSL